MSASPAVLQRLPRAAGTQKDAGEPYRVPVRYPNGELAYNATKDQESELRAAGLADEVRSPRGMLRYLRLHRDHRLLRPDPMLEHVITRANGDGLTWDARHDRAHTGRVGSTTTLHIRP